MQYLCTGYVGQENIIASATSGRSTSLKNIQVWQCLMDDQYACSYTTYQANFLLPHKCWPSTTNAIVCKRCMYLHTIVYVCVCARRVLRVHVLISWPHWPLPMCSWKFFFVPKQQYGVNVTTNNMEVVERSQIIWLAVKPHAIGRVLREVTPVVRPDQMIISTAAGIPIKEIEKVCYVSKINNKPSLQEYSRGSGYVCLQTCQD